MADIADPPKAHFAVILSVEQGTQLWIAGLLLAAAVFHLVKK